MTNSGVNAYQSVGAGGAVGGASREQLVQMLLDGALTRIATAKGHIQANPGDPTASSNLDGTSFRRFPKRASNQRLDALANAARGKNGKKR